MIVKTINPVIVNGQKESRPSKYLSFDANGKPTNSAETKKFQDWLDVKHKGWAVGYKNGILNKGAGYGKYPFGNLTNTAWNTFGSEFVADSKSLGANLFGIGTPSISSSTPTEPSKEEQIKQAKKGKVWDKAKGWITSDKAKDALAFLQNSGGVKGFLGSIFGGGSSDQGTGAVQTSSEGSYGSGLPTELPYEKQKWSTGKKVAVFGGGALVLGLVIYFATRPKK